MSKTYVIYLHRNKINNKVYIGQTGLAPPERRFGKNGKYYKECTYFYNAIQKYGWSNFEHIILEQDLTLQEANEREEYYIKLYNSTNHHFGYNIRKGGLHSEISEETCLKISKKLKGKKLSEETKRKMSKNQAKKRKIMCIETGEIFDSVTSAGKWAGLKNGNSILNFLSGKTESAGKHPKTKIKLHWKYYGE